MEIVWVFVYFTLINAKRFSEFDENRADKHEFQSNNGKVLTNRHLLCYKNPIFSSKNRSSGPLHTLRNGG
jgi:hypothetical protein